MSDRFELENNIVDLYNIGDDLDLVIENLLDSDERMDKEDIANALAGVKTLLDMRIKKLFNTFKAAFKLDGSDKITV